jgi:GTP pyrophosphokinase
MSQERENTSEMDIVQKAAIMAKEAHGNQKRDSGEDYFTHPEGVANILKKWGIDDPIIITAAYLHDCPEDTNLSLERIRKEFGDEVAGLVDGVTKLSNGTKKDTTKKVLKESYINPNTALLKLADRLYNLRTLNSLSPERQIKIATETLDVYTRLAESLGLWEIKIEMEDLCYQYVKPKEYKETVSQVNSDERLTPLFTANITSQLNQILNENDIDGYIIFRRNGYKTLKTKQGKLAQEGKCSPDSFKEINDLVSFRIILNSENDIYPLVGLLHQKYGEMVDYERFDEFIGANKRINGYEAIQTTVNFPQAGPVEIALVTKRMEEFNRLGVVSKIRNGDEDIDEYILKLIFTPTGRVRYLPKEATGVDFATNLNLQLLSDANYMLVDGQKKELSEVLLNASTVEIIFGDPRRAPLPGLENFCLPETKRVIENLRIQEKNDKLIRKGKEIVREVISSRGLLELGDLGNRINQILFKFGCSGTHNLYSKIANGGVSIEELTKELDNIKVTKEELQITTVELKGINKPQILLDFLNKVSTPQHNIVQIEQKCEKDKNNNELFNLRMTISGMTKEDENELTKFLAKDERFSDFTVV